MDPVTHGLVGAALNQALTRRPVRARAAAVCGMAAAMAADLDVLAGAAGDPLQAVEVHRHVTHALAFVPVGALVVAALMWWPARRWLTRGQLYLACLLGLATSGIVDACTSYGTHLWWPFSDARVAWNLVSVFDPLCSLGVAAGVSIAFARRTAAPARWGLVWFAAYLALGAVQHQRATDAGRRLAAQRGHRVEALVAKPTMGNQLLWGVRTLTADSLYADGVRLPPFAGAQVYPGEAAPRYDWRRLHADLAGTTLHRDLARFDALSEGFLVRHPRHPGVIGDGRYAMLPDRVQPLWGITVDPTRADRHVAFGSYRDADAEVRRRFLDMLLGRGALPAGSIQLGRVVGAGSETGGGE